MPCCVVLGFVIFTGIAIHLEPYSVLLTHAHAPRRSRSRDGEEYHFVRLTHALSRPKVPLPPSPRIDIHWPKS